MLNFTLSPQMKALILRAKEQGGTTTCDPRAMYPVGHKCAATTQPIKSTGLQYIKLAQGDPVADQAQIVRRTTLPTRETVTEIKTANGETVKATTAPNGGVAKVEVKEMKWLMPAAIAAAAFVLLGG